MEIRYCTHNSIDKQRWDDLLDKSPQSRIYAYSWYLDSMSPHWDALIGGDYESIFPLPWNKKLLGIKRIIKPRLCQQLGLFTLENEISGELIHKFLQCIPSHFKAIDFNLNELNPVPHLKEWKVNKRVNMYLPLLADYPLLYTQYSDHHKRNLKKSLSAELKVFNNMAVDSLIDAFLVQNKEKIKDFSTKQKRSLASLMNQSLIIGTGLIRAIEDSRGNLHCAVFLQHANGRLYYLLPLSTEMGRKSSAMYYLLDLVFKEFAGTDTVFDFEGSALPGVAKFYKGFGALESHYFQVSRDKLPKWAKWVLSILRSFTR